MGLGTAKMHCKDSGWSTTSTEGVTVVDLKLRVDQMQSMSFAPGTLPSSCDWDTPSCDKVLGTKKPSTHKRKDVSEMVSVSAGAEDCEGESANNELDKQMEAQKEEHAGKMKGLKQVL